MPRPELAACCAASARRSASAASAKSASYARRFAASSSVSAACRAHQVIKQLQTLTYRPYTAHHRPCRCPSERASFGDNANLTNVRQVRLAPPLLTRLTRWAASCAPTAPFALSGCVSSAFACLARLMTAASAPGLTSRTSYHVVTLSTRRISPSAPGGTSGFR